MGVIMVLGIVGMCMPVVLPAIAVFEVFDAILYVVEGIRDMFKF